jgi:glycosyltransferase involved in cell wall biosynthesis
VVVVDDGSSDRTLEHVGAFARTRPVRVVEHGRSYGIGPARNAGARASRGDVLFFCDGDDFFLPEHLFVGFSLLDLSARAEEIPGPVRLRIGARGHLVWSPARPFAALRTGVVLRDEILPYWKRVTENTLAQNLCVRRECHDWGEGFPENAVYKKIGGCEDAAYSDWLCTFFRVGRVPLETVEYVRRPGNSLDRQLARFRHPRGSEFDRPATPEQQAIHDVRRRLEDERVAYLLDKWRVVGPPVLAPGLIHWENIHQELVRTADPYAADLAAQATRHGQPLPAAAAGGAS